MADVFDMQKVIDIENIKLPSLNNKFMNRSYSLTPEYRKFKEMIFRVAVKHKPVDPPYNVLIEFTGYTDIDNPIKCIIDGLQQKGIIDNDKNVLGLTINKIPIKRGRLSKLAVYLSHIEDYDKNYNKGV
jgi:Holliday junction resolvase RusA-like endonuclease